MQHDPWGVFRGGVSVTGASLFGSNSGTSASQPTSQQYFNIIGGDTGPSGTSSFASGHSSMPPSIGVSIFGVTNSFLNQIGLDGGNGGSQSQPALGTYAASMQQGPGQVTGQNPGPANGPPHQTIQFLTS